MNMGEFIKNIIVCTILFFAFSIGLTSRAIAVSTVDTTATTYFEDIAEEILKLNSFEDLFSLEGFLDDYYVESVKEIDQSATPTSETNFATSTQVVSENLKLIAPCELLFKEYVGGPLPGGIDFVFESGNLILGVPDLVKFYKNEVLIDTLSGKTILAPFIVEDFPVSGGVTTVFRFLTGDYAIPLGSFYLTAVASKTYTLTTAVNAAQCQNIVDVNNDGVYELIALDDHMVKALPVTELSLFKRFFKWTEDGWRVDEAGEFKKAYGEIASADFNSIATASPRTPYVWSYAYHSYMAGHSLKDIESEIAKLVDEHYLHWLIDPLELVKTIDMNINEFESYVMEKAWKTPSPNM